MQLWRFIKQSRIISSIHVSISWASTKNEGPAINPGPSFEVTNVVFLSELRIMDAFGGVGGIFGALLQTGNYQLGTGTLAAGSGRNIVLVAAYGKTDAGITATSSDLWVITRPILIYLVPGISVTLYSLSVGMTYQRNYSQIPTVTLSVTTTAITCSGTPNITILYLYTT